MPKFYFPNMNSEELYDLFAFGGPDVIPDAVIQHLFSEAIGAMNYYDTPYSLNDALRGRRYFVAPLNKFGTHSGRQIRVFGIPYEGIELEGERLVKYVKNDHGLLMPTER